MITSEKEKTSGCCYEAIIDNNDYIEEFNKEYCSDYPDGYGDSNWKNYIPFLLITPKNDIWFHVFQEQLYKKDKYLFLKYKYALLYYLKSRKIDLWKKAYYLDEKPNFKKLCEFFCSKEERDWRKRKYYNEDGEPNCPYCTDCPEIPF
tara:strand:- start:1061 stop:1504 length:444 start_codon:yes stop_codon:yes gene_type:complete